MLFSSEQRLKLRIRGCPRTPFIRLEEETHFQRGCLSA
jgi:hypothetical protein